MTTLYVPFCNVALHVLVRFKFLASLQLRLGRFRWSYIQNNLDAPIYKLLISIKISMHCQVWFTYLLNALWYLLPPIAFSAVDIYVCPQPLIQIFYSVCKVTVIPTRLSHCVGDSYKILLFSGFSTWKQGTLVRICYWQLTCCCFFKFCFLLCINIYLHFLFIYAKICFFILFLKKGFNVSHSLCASHNPRICYSEVRILFCTWNFQATQ